MSGPSAYAAAAMNVARRTPATALYNLLMPFDYAARKSRDKRCGLGCAQWSTPFSARCLAKPAVSIRRPVWRWTQISALTGDRLATPDNHSFERRCASILTSKIKSMRRLMAVICLSGQVSPALALRLQQWLLRQFLWASRSFALMRRGAPEAHGGLSRR